MQVVVQDIVTQYKRHGKGKVILLLHGWGDTGASWDSTAQSLAAQYDVVVPDLPGFGGTGQPKEAWSLSEYAVFVRDFLHKLGLSPYAIIGHSNGGAIAVRGIGQGHFNAEKLVLLASAGVRSPRASYGLNVIAKVGKIVASPLPRRVRSRLRTKLYAKAGSDLLVAEHMQETFKRIVRDDVRADAAYISTPTLLVYGDRDEQTPLSIAQQLEQAIEGSRLQVIPHAGHFLYVDAPKETLQLVQDFLHA